MQTSSRVCTARCSDHLEVQEIVFYLSDETIAAYLAELADRGQGRHHRSPRDRHL